MKSYVKIVSPQNCSQLQRGTPMDLTQMFCQVDDFCIEFESSWHPFLLETGLRKRRRRRCLSNSEVMTLLFLFHQMGFRTFKDFYVKYALHQLKKDFPGLPSYSRFIELKKSCLIPMFAFLYTLKGECSGISFLDATSLSVCHNNRARKHKTFDGLVGWGKDSVKWYYGFKLHLAVNDKGELLSFSLTPGNTDDREVVLELLKGFFGRFYADKGYISQKLREDLYQRGIELFTTIRKNMRPRIISLFDKLMLRKRVLIEGVIDQLKNISQIEHSRHRSPENFVVNLLAGLVAYMLQPKKPSLNIREEEKTFLPVLA